MIVATKLREKFGRGEVLLGTMVMYVRTPGIVRMAMEAGLDYVLIDLQHSNLGFETVADMCEIARASEVAALIRPNRVDVDTINRLQDLGADGFMFHNVVSADQIASAVEMVRYPPAGARGIAIAGPGSDYRTARIDAEFLGASNDRVFVIAQIESREGLDHLDEILDVPGIDAVEVGRQDLSISLGVPGEADHPLVADAIDRVSVACRQRDVALALSAGSVEHGQQLVERGARLVTWRTDKAILLDSYRRFTEGMSTAKPSRSRSV